MVSVHSLSEAPQANPFPALSISVTSPSLPSSLIKRHLPSRFTSIEFPRIGISRGSFFPNLEYRVAFIAKNLQHCCFAPRPTGCKPRQGTVSLTPAVSHPQRAESTLCHSVPFFSTPTSNNTHSQWKIHNQRRSPLPTARLSATSHGRRSTERCASCLITRCRAAKSCTSKKQRPRRQ